MPEARSLAVLLVSTWAFTVCFAVWMMFGVTGIPIREELGLDATQFGLLTATPVLTGALFRLPLGIWTDRFGGRLIMLLLLVGCAVPLWLSAYATALWQLLLLGLALGLVGASFSVGTPYVARFFPKERRGFAMGFFGAGTIGAALNMFAAPILIDNYGWQAVPKTYAVCLLATAAVFWVFSAPDPGAGKAGSSVSQQLAVLRDPRVWKYCQYYSIVFGGFTALSVWMPQYFRSEYGFSIAQASLLAASFSLPGGAFRALGGWLSDRFGAHAVTWWVLWLAWICLFLLSYPRTQLTIFTVKGPVSFAIWLVPWLFTPLLFGLGIAFAFGMASTFKYIGDDFPDSIGAVSGIVGMAGGLGGFLLPIMFGAILDLLGVNSSCFMLLYGIVWVSLILIYLTEVRRAPVMGEDTAQPASVQT
ncbi:nitrate/nitrite transporter [Mesorhizobium sp. M2C.T.Ca.TU.002.02.1.1]|uniref:MFS transporter n=1 Tax=Mesorhizobium sp. M2C.T.Ca.TU.002.02.1.1 TaxID=2496788 RepID=UPI000FCC851B|nr:nitrate/nitrite transporter [Mesorhizobium sp. M2C.T.Ca.TU.002.02.1.1]RUU57652.1 NarK/NasA family nitrate transporter [Mesorhizobium sp. M2C.T.Ca.TU.002.02.1.1]RUU72100.1 NarK/NasA family nitrate transporter [Mesorhizobium sp. M2C.T.Ca.TU.009.01.2.1]